MVLLRSLPVLLMLLLLHGVAVANDVAVDGNVFLQALQQVASESLGVQQIQVGIIFGSLQ